MCNSCSVARFDPHLQALRRAELLDGVLLNVKGADHRRLVRLDFLKPDDVLGRVIAAPLLRPGTVGPYLREAYMVVDLQRPGQGWWSPAISLKSVSRDPIQSVLSVAAGFGRAGTRGRRRA